MFKAALIVYYKGQHEKILPGVESILYANKISFSIVDREKLTEKDYKKKDIIIVIGGDGTFLRANHLNKDVPMIGINPNPGRKEGFYMQADANNYLHVVKKVIDGKFMLKNLLRLQVKVNGKLLNHFVLNDVYIGDSKPYLLFNYEIRIKKITEFQRGSGVVIGTPSGSSAWLRSAGGDRMEIEDNNYQYAARELYIGKLTKDYRITKGILNRKETLEIVPKSKGIVVIDSISPEYKVKIDDKIAIFPAQKPLKYIAVD